MASERNLYAVRRGPPAGRRLRRAVAGVTLLELMIVVAVIGIGAALAAPAARAAMKERRVSEFSLDLVRLVRRARSEAMAFGRAHMLRYDGSDGTGNVTLYRGLNNGCNTNDWNGVVVAAGGCNVPGSFCVDGLDLSRFTVGGMRYRMVESTGLQTVDVCYEPGGAMRYRTGADVGSGGRFLEVNNIGGGFLFFVSREVDGGTRGVIRRVLLPLGADARLVR